MLCTSVQRHCTAIQSNADPWRIVATPSHSAAKQIDAFRFLRASLRIDAFQFRSPADLLCAWRFLSIAPPRGATPSLLHASPLLGIVANHSSSMLSYSVALLDFFPAEPSFAGIPPLTDAGIAAVVEPFADYLFVVII